MKLTSKITVFLALITALSFMVQLGSLAFCFWSGGNGPPSP
jgi:hypothetical protein